MNDKPLRPAGRGSILLIAEELDQRTDEGYAKFTREVARVLAESHSVLTHTTELPRGEDQDDWWTNIGAAFPHKNGEGYTIVLQAIPLDGKIVLRPPKEKDEGGTEHAQQTIREENDRRRGTRRDR